MSVTVNDLHRKFTELAKDGFTGESVVRLLGSESAFFNVPKDVKDTARVAQDLTLIMSVYSMCFRCKAFGSITLIWHEGSVVNLTVKLAFQGADTRILAQNLFRCGG
jgi:hypothetical protein